ncbi:hypothetical protein JOC54_000233 [Alkalihalobacillus xiaoxiensis]|uniref:Uncharacterized protein n=1 Tax=Shouchella xiaoxiensis TaxID=766895 RepID=A0ABS2SNA1_9BACI|nr:hypothetical protein [Shouchella xiaoxiensis]MBM7837002.1 hypothetical protein [Shouchella xiaoxiensis]
MKKGILISILIILFIVGGFFVIRAMNQAEDVALSDEFTSRFLDEDVETHKGFHYFESGNGKFSMWFPEGYYVEEDPSIYISKPHYEAMQFFEKETSTDTRGALQLRYQKEDSQRSIDHAFNRLLDGLAFDNQYETEEIDNRIIHYGASYQDMVEKQVETSNPNDILGANRYFAFIQDQEGTQYILINYRLNCSNRSKCNIDDEAEAEFFQTIYRNITFAEG